MSDYLATVSHRDASINEEGPGHNENFSGGGRGFWIMTGIGLLLAGGVTYFCATETKLKQKVDRFSDLISQGEYQQALEIFPEMINDIETWALTSAERARTATEWLHGLMGHVQDRGQSNETTQRLIHDIGRSQRRIRSA